MGINEAIRLSATRRVVAARGLAAIREAALLTQHDVADACRVSVGTVARWEAGQGRPRRRQALLLADLLEGIGVGNQ